MDTPPRAPGSAESERLHGTDPLDAVAAAPEHHRVLLENAAVRVLETRIEPGERVRLHTHRWPAVYYILAWSDFVRRNERGEVTLDSRAGGAAQRRPGEAMWSPPLGPPTLENVGTSAMHVISVEVKVGV